MMRVEGKVDRYLCRPCYRLHRKANHLKQTGEYEALDPIKAVQFVKRRCEKVIDRLAAPATRIRGIKSATDELNATRKDLYLIDDYLRCVLGIVKRCSAERWRMDDFRAQVRELVNELPKAASVDAENVWVYGSLQEDSPDFSQAPSIGACNTWISCHTNPDMEKEFLKMLWRYRQPLARTKQSQFGVDRAEADRQADDQSDAELMERLFGRD